MCPVAYDFYAKLSELASSCTFDGQTRGWRGSPRLAFRLPFPEFLKIAQLFIVVPQFHTLSIFFNIFWGFCLLVFSTLWCTFLKKKKKHKCFRFSQVFMNLKKKSWFYVGFFSLPPAPQTSCTKKKKQCRISFPPPTQTSRSLAPCSFLSRHSTVLRL